MTIMIGEVKSHSKFIGLKQSRRAIEEGKAVKAFIAEDSAEDIRHDITELCNKHNVEIEYVPTMEQLGNECGIDVGSAVVVITG